MDGYRLNIKSTSLGIRLQLAMGKNEKWHSYKATETMESSPAGVRCLYSVGFPTPTLPVNDMSWKNCGTQLRLYPSMICHDCQNNFGSLLYKERSRISRLATCHPISRVWTHLHSTSAVGNIHQPLSSLQSCHRCQERIYVVHAAVKSISVIYTKLGRRVFSHAEIQWLKVWVSLAQLVFVMDESTYEGDNLPKK